MTELIRNSYEHELNQHWEEKTQDPINLRLGSADGLYHHHYAVGDFDRSILSIQDHAERENAILREMHRLESEQVDLITDVLTATPDSRIMDAGSGRGGTSFMLNERFKSDVTGVNFCSHHVDFAQELSHSRGVAEQVKFRLGNMVETGLPDASFTHVVSNETTMYVDLDEAFTEFARLLEPGGQYVLVTWCRNDVVSAGCPEIEKIDEHYVCDIHSRSEYLNALLSAGLTPTVVQNLTVDAIPYWELRVQSELATGIEQPFLDAYRDNTLNYIVIAAEKPVAGHGSSRPVR